MLDNVKVDIFSMDKCSYRFACNLRIKAFTKRSIIAVSDTGNVFRIDINSKAVYKNREKIADTCKYKIRVDLYASG